MFCATQRQGKYQKLDDVMCNYAKVQCDIYLIFNVEKFMPALFHLPSPDRHFILTGLTGNGFNRLTLFELPIS